jgi:hypothetical protein
LKTGENRPFRFFISYRRSVATDAQLAQRLGEGFKRAGHEVFIDINMPIGTDWVTEIDQRIAWCDALIVLLSEESIGSEMVQSEVRRAYRQRGKTGRPRILPLRVNFEGPLDYELDSYIGRIQYCIWMTPEDTDRVLKELLRATGTDPLADEIRVPLQGPIKLREPMPSMDPRTLYMPGGTMRVKDPFYIRRMADDRVEAAARSAGETIIIKGPRQVGKSSLLMRYLNACADAGRRSAFLERAWKARLYSIISVT